MAPTPPDGLTVPALITAKGTQLKYWIVQTNGAADKKVLNVSGTVDQLRENLAAYYSLDLTANPSVGSITAPTVDQSIRDRQWADLEALGFEWREKATAGLVFKLMEQGPATVTCAESILATSQDPALRLDDTAATAATQASISVMQPHNVSVNTGLLSDNPNNPAPNTPFNANAPFNNHSSLRFIGNQRIPGSAIQVSFATSSTAPAVTHQPIIPSTTAAAAGSQRDAAILQDLSTVITGLQRCEGLRDIIQQIESGAVQAIRERYGPQPGRRNTAHDSWSKYSNLVSKRERLHRILTQDFNGNKVAFFAFFSVPPPISKKRKHIDTGTTPAEEHFRSFRKIVEAIPWCEADLAAERRNNQYLGADGEFSDAQWMERWGIKNSWEVWREIGKERYTKTSNEGQKD